MAFTPRYEPVVQLLSTNGDGTGTNDWSGDYSLTADEFYIQQQAADDDRAILVHRLLWQIQDTGRFDAEGFGAGAALSNGLTLEWRESDDTVIADLTPVPIISNAQFGLFAYDVDVATWGAGDEVLRCRWTLGKFLPGDGLQLQDGQKLVLTVNDNLSILVNAYCMAQGYSHSYNIR